MSGGIGEVLVSARSFEEYVAMFDLVDSDPAGTVLDGPGGAAGFTASAVARGVDATAVDPACAGGPAALAALAGHAAAEAQRAHEHLLRHVDGYVWMFFTDPADHLRARLAAVEVFAAGVAAHPERYVTGTLPHLLFTDADRFNEVWHLAALVELARVGRQVRVFPLVSHVDGSRYPHLDRLRDALAERGIASYVRRVGYELQRGGDEVLVLDVGPTTGVGASVAAAGGGR